eukprot:evm.model.scf_35.6 EVM.evm.TU.scf_35.6   scf_35:54456-57851(+)
MASDDAKDTEAKRGGADAPSTSGSGQIEPSLREDQIQNAVAFMAHPKVRDAGDDAKRSFLLRKGLTKAEIAEAFDRVRMSSVDAVVAKGPDVVVSPGGVPGTAPTVAFSGQQVSAPQQAVALQGQGRTGTGSAGWSKAVLGLGVLAAGSYAFTRYAAPYIQNWLWPGGAPVERVEALEHSQKTTKTTVDNVETICTEVRYRTTSLENSMRNLAKDVRSLSLKVDRLLASQQKLPNGLNGSMPVVNEAVPERPALTGDSHLEEESRQPGYMEVLSMIANDHETGHDGALVGSKSGTSSISLHLHKPWESTMVGCTTDDVLRPVNSTAVDQNGAAASGAFPAQNTLPGGVAGWTPPPLPTPTLGANAVQGPNDVQVANAENGAEVVESDT